MNPFTAFYDNIKHKTTNPFFGTLILVWFSRNWNLIYTVFNFDSEYKLAEKKKFIEDYFKSQNFWEELAINVGITLLLFIIGYLIIVITRVFINVIEHRTIPFLNSKTVSKLVVGTEIYEKVREDRDRLTQDIINKNEIVLNLELNNKELRSEVERLNASNQQRQSEIIEKEHLINTINQTVESLKSSLEKLQIEYNHTNNNYSALRESDTELLKQYLSLKEDNAQFKNILLSDYYNPQINDEHKRIKIPNQILKDFYEIQDNELSMLQNIYKPMNEFDEEMRKRTSYNMSYLSRLKDMGLINYSDKIKDIRGEDILRTTYGEFMIAYSNIIMSLN